MTSNSGPTSRKPSDVECKFRWVMCALARPMTRADRNSVFVTRTRYSSSFRTFWVASIVCTSVSTERAASCAPPASANADETLEDISSCASA